eukprot:scaffold13640_cov65-Attheya_sp.AAC.6
MLVAPLSSTKFLKSLGSLTVNRSPASDCHVGALTGVNKGRVVPNFHALKSSEYDRKIIRRIGTEHYLGVFFKDKVHIGLEVNGSLDKECTRRYHHSTTTLFGSMVDSPSKGGRAVCRASGCTSFIIQNRVTRVAKRRRLDSLESGHNFVPVRSSVGPFCQKLFRQKHKHNKAAAVPTDCNFHDDIGL